ncbi:MAG: DUF1249 domain-containing protein [Gammaproteobacteria bacterium]|nr:DUF1249 domain-containing protein [Gammaproteobacteria bacterium]
MILTRKKRNGVPSMYVFEMNYAKIMRLFPTLRDSVIGVQYMHHDAKDSVRIEVVEIGPYTSTLELNHQIFALKDWVPDLQITIQVYHDAKVAEVIAYQKQERFQVKYEYPNPRMHHRREKSDLNRFLTDWLDYCLKYQAAQGMLVDIE